jgi:hypothetical protein
MSQESLIDVLDLGGDGSQPAALETVRIGYDETPVLPFTSQGASVRTHWCEEPEIKGWVACAGDGCLLCKAGRRADDRLLIPVYMPVDRRVSVLMMSTVLRPRSLRPQYAEHVKKAEAGGYRAVLFIKKAADNAFAVTSVPLRDGEDDGAEAVKQFRAAHASGEIQLASVVQHVDEQHLRAVPGIAALLRLKGLVSP